MKIFMQNSMWLNSIKNIHMKRHESIAPLSRDHHFGLLCSWKIRQGLKKGIAPQRIQKYIQYFWDHHLKQHFEEEETLLFIEIKDAQCDQAIAEHTELKNMVTANNTSTAAGLNEFADLLDKHIRFEERILFPHLEKVLPEEKLTVIGNRLQQLHNAPEQDDYNDEFWV